MLCTGFLAFVSPEVADVVEMQPICCGIPSAAVYFRTGQRHVLLLLGFGFSSNLFP